MKCSTKKVKLSVYVSIPILPLQSQASSAGKEMEKGRFGIQEIVQGLGHIPCMCSKRFSPHIRSLVMPGPQTSPGVKLDTPSTAKVTLVVLALNG